MQPIVRPLLVLHADEEFCHTLSLVPGGAYSLQRCADWTALRAALRRAPANAICIVPGAESEGAPDHLGALLSEFPSATVLAAVEVHPGRAELLRILIGWGVADTIDLLREDSPQALARRLRLVQTRSVSRLLTRALPRGVPSRTRWLLTRAAEVVALGGAAPQLALALDVDERTVPRWCRRADLPPPRTLLAWLRVLLAADLLEDPGRSIESVARSCGYANSMSLKSAVRSLFNLTPRALRDRGAFAFVASSFADHLYHLREAAREQGRPPATWLN
jgi:AraC-like DNA-binding protein